MKLPRVPVPFPKPSKAMKDIRKPTRMQEKINLNKLLKEESR